MVDSNEDNDNTSQQADQLRHLRNLVVGPTADSLEELRGEFQDRSVSSEEVSEVLSDAIRKSAKKKDLSRALGPTISEAFQESVRRDPQSLADAISPIMGPAIRRSISQQIRAMVQSLNTALDHSLSPRGIKWRLEAYRTGKPFAEVVLLHTLVYRIEQLLLIDPHTGLLMQSVSADPGADDADLVSSLLSAIQDFMRDSFEHRNDESGSDLQQMDTNELQVWIVHGPSAILAAAVRGEPPVRLRERMEEVLEQVHLQHSSLLGNFRGDTTPLEIVQPDLEELLDSEYINQKSDSRQEQEEAKDPGWTRHLSWAIPACLLLMLLVWGLQSRRSAYRRQIAETIDLPPTATLEILDESLRIEGTVRSDWITQAKNRMDRLPQFKRLDVEHDDLAISDKAWVSFIEALREEPGIAVMSAERDGENYVLRGWKDPLALDPLELANSKFQLDPSRIRQHWEAYHAVDSRLALKRLQKHVEFPDTITFVDLQKESGRLVLKGSAKLSWLQELQYAMELLDTGDTVDISQLNVVDG